MSNIFYGMLDNNTEYRKFKENIQNNNFPIYATGTVNTQKSQLMASLTDRGESALVITHSQKRVKELQRDLGYFLHERVVAYPGKDVIFYWADIKSNDIIKKRYEVLSKLINKEPVVVVACIDALIDRLVPENVIEKYITSLKVGDSVDINELSSKLLLMGYERCAAVETQGQFALRGGILDVFSTVNENAVRMEFFGDEIDSLRIFDTNSQRTIENTESVKIYPVRELVYSKEDGEKAKERVLRELKSLKDPSDRLKAVIEEDMERLENLKSFSGVEKYINFFYKETVNLLDYFHKNSYIFVDEPKRVEEYLEEVTGEFKESMLGRIEAGTMLPSSMGLIFSEEEMLKNIRKRNTVYFSDVLTFEGEKSATVDFKTKSVFIPKNDIEALAQSLRKLCDDKYKVIYMAGGHTRCERMYKELTERGVKCVFTENTVSEAKEGFTYILRGSLTNGFEYGEDKFILLTDSEIFGDIKRRKKKKSTGLKIEDYNDLKPGDLVVHEYQGVGVYKGMEKIVTDNISKDYLKLEYSGGDTLYVAVNQMDVVQKYIGGEGVKPKLDHLGGSSWGKTKKKAKETIKILAENLIKLYAKRQSTKGYLYPPDTVWQKEFEEDFEYTETEDQLLAIEDVKNDMEKGIVMDRLICGDVGYGKTEVAIRAAFKTLQEGKQVAVLVPTTILASQHFSNFSKRFKNYPVNVGLLSRFVTPAKQKKVIAGLKSGETDIVIGTHRLLNKSISYKDLGLIVVDEEQRFGVAQKEKLKNISENVNVLTLSATPIPRTLHMSMSGIRDMSLLEEPPGDRLPIQTYVMEYDEEFVKNAVRREVSRGGQVYFMHNRVNNIEDVANDLRSLLPDVRIAVAHGQMSERELEDIMMDFINGEIDLLVCTTIIETGLDIPNVNTIIINNADTMGLSQLYQLRGRVGRSARKSFAYLLYKKNKILRSESEQRLKAIKEFTELGSGFKVAMRDLEIRGAGDVLGAKQSGHLEQIGYEMYCRLLETAIKELNGKPEEKEFETLVDLNINAYIPTDYIEDEVQKLEMYKKIAGIKDKNDYYNVFDEVTDRFGQPPKVVQNLLDVVLIKAYAHVLGVTNIKQRANAIVFTLGKDADIDTSKFMELVKLYGKDLSYTNYEKNALITFKAKDDKKILKETTEFLEKFKTTEGREDN